MLCVFLKLKISFKTNQFYISIMEFFDKLQNLKNSIFCKFTHFLNIENINFSQANYVVINKKYMALSDFYNNK